MNKLQQAADEHAGNNCTSCNHRGTYGPCVCNKLERAFLAGAEYAAGVFAEWCRKNYCTIDSHNYPEHKKENSWYIPGTTNRYTTTELYQLWQQSL